MLAAFGAGGDVLEELLAYNENVFQHHGGADVFPLPPEPHVARWRFYCEEGARDGLFPSLQKRFPQLNFPVKEGMSTGEEYRAAVRRGTPVKGLSSATGLELERPDQMTLVVHPTFAGEIPVWTLFHRKDFVSIVQALIYKNEPKPVADAVGAMMIGGFNNWDRIHAYRENWESANPSGSWRDEFRNLIKDKSRYQDRFILLSVGPYSGVPASGLGMEEEAWRQSSSIIRREHECTHYFTRRVFSSMRNNIIDETIADYMGIVAANGSYRSDWFLHFLGLEDFPRYREGGRLENYRGTLSDQAFDRLKGLAKAAADHLEAFDREHAERLKQPENKVRFLMALTRLTLEELASEKYASLLAKHWARPQQGGDPHTPVKDE